MASALDRVLGAIGLQRAFNPFTPAEWRAIQQNSMGMSYPQFTMGNNKQEPIGAGFSSLVTQAYATNPVVFACVNARAQLFSEARFQFQRLKDGRPGELFNTPSTYLRLLETPWSGGSTSQLLKDMLIDADLAGNAFVLREASGLRRLRPDWVTIIAGNPRANGTTWDLDTEVLGYGYQPDGPQGGKEKIFLQRSEVAHFKSTHDPLRRFSGMPWLLPVLRDLSSDGAATSYKQMYFENAATPNLTITFPETMLKAQALDWAAEIRKNHEGAANAFKTLFLGGGATATPVGNNLTDSAFTDVQGKGELRIASAGGVPPIIIGLAGGLDAATYSNYGQARRAFSDLTMRPLWRGASEALETITSVPENARLWYDDRDIPFLQEDMKDAADIQSVQAVAIRQLIDAGYEADSVIDAVVAGDFTRLKHSGLYSVQLQPPGTQTPTPEAPVAPAPASDATRSADFVSVDIRCSNCDKLVGKRTAPGGGFEVKCDRCRNLVTA